MAKAKAKEEVTRKSTAKKTNLKPSAEKAVEKKTVADKPVAKKAVAKKAASKTTVKKAVATKAVKKTETKKTLAKKPAAKKTASKKKDSKTEVITPEPSVAKEIAVPSVRYSNKDLEIFRETIEDSRVEAIEELRMLKERLDDLTNYDFAEESMIYSMHMAEQGSEAMEKEKTYAQIQRINEYIKKLDEALQRIINKTYGICRVCGCLIARERLIAVPVTTLSAAYKIHQKCPEDGIDRIEPVQ